MTEMPHSKIAVVLVNTGSPAAPTKEALSQYLAEFLGDPRVVEISPWIWKPILHGVIIPKRAQASAERYKTVWTEDGSPLMAISKRTAQALGQALGEDYCVTWAMCYGTHRLGDVLKRVMASSPRALIVLPMFAQYATQTTEAVYDALGRAVRRLDIRIPIARIYDWFDHPLYIEALTESVREHWAHDGTLGLMNDEKLMMSFHGIPQASTNRGDPYEMQCQRTANALRRALELDAHQVELVFQSKFGRQKWIGPAASDRAQALGESGLRRLDVICPGFAADCLETLEEIACELKRTYEQAGGRRFTYIGALNDSAAAVRLYAALVRQAQETLPEPVR